MKPILNNLITVRLTNPNSTKYCDIRFNYAKKEILNSKTYDAGKLIEYKHKKGYVKYSPDTGFPITSMFEDAKTKIIRGFQRKSNKLKSLFRLNKTTNEKYVASFDSKETLRDLIVHNQQNNTHTALKMNKNGDIVDIKGDKLDKDISSIKFNKNTSKFEFRTKKQINEDKYNIYSSETLYIDDLNSISKEYSTSFPKTNNPSRQAYTSINTYIEKNGKQQEIEAIIYDTNTKEMILHEIKDTNGNQVYGAVRMTNEDGTNTYRLIGDYNNGKIIDVKRPDKL